MHSKSNKSFNLLNAKQLSEMLSVSVRHVWRMKSAGKLPQALNVAGCVRWSLRDIELYLEMGCPSQEKFSVVKKSKRGGK